MDDKIKERFFAKVEKTDTCWLWTGSLEKNGYARFKIGDKKLLCHRSSWIIAGNTIPEGHVIRHKCRNRHCVNPEHLEAGTYSENNGADRVRDGTLNNGTKNGNSKLAEEQVLEIRARAEESQRELAEEFGVSISTLNKIILRRVWKHI